MAGLFAGRRETNAGSHLSVGRELFLLLRVGVFRKGRMMGKFFLIIIAVSVAILLAMSAYVISL
ncbi:hypothetical protein CQ14_37765 [Bradyrhizobium lablabi]|uniref:Uncharacterized protein n=1 Tax=Bradyrhizobium lablabi TaxID=722472 RepID=A0A0R3MQD1_9BRAD|nr:hypothetical protein [Bradyrhizobium lablabi]KRR22313.1 hypothetical protein CQ14_37765 [Bradyrhizobium lablabi]